MKAKIFITLVFAMLLSSCAKEYFADRKPKKWNDEYVDPTYIWEHKNSIAFGDTVMVCGWLGDPEFQAGYQIAIHRDSCSTFRGAFEDYNLITNIKTTRCWFRDYDLDITLPERPCKVYVTGCFEYWNIHCEWDYCVCPLSEDDIIFVPTNKNE